MELMAKLRSIFSETYVIAEGRGAGLKLVARGADPNFARGIYEQPMQETVISNLSAGDVFFDVGANIGFFSLIAARRVGAEGHVYAFEPVPRNVVAIRRSAQLNDLAMIRVFSEAVGAKTGRAELLLAHHIGGAALASVGAPPDMRGRMQVDVVTLDDAVTRRGLRPPSLVKIDVEGAEIDVLRGMTEIMRRFRPKIIYEVDDATREGLACKARNIAAFMTGAGYTLALLPACYRDEDWHVEHVFACPMRM